MKCKACYGKKQHSVLEQERGSDDFGGEGYVAEPKMVLRACSRCHGTGEEPSHLAAQQTPTPHKEKMCLCGGTGYVDTGKGAEGPCRACRPEKEKREDAGECKSCGGPSTVDFKRYPGGSFCENKGCPAYQEIPAAKEGGDFQKQWDEIMHGTNPATIYGTRRLEWENVLEIGVFSGKFNALFSLLEKYADALPRTRKEAEEKAWRAAVEAVPEATSEVCHCMYHGCFRSCDCWNEYDGKMIARQQLITAAKDHGVNIEV